MTSSILRLAVLLMAMCSVAAAQTGKVHRVALVMSFSTEEGLPYRTAFLDAMRDLGYVEGRNVVFDVRTSDRDTATVESLANELIALKPDIFVGGTAVVKALRAKNVRIPVVLPGSIDPVGEGLAQSLRRPGLNVTGASLLLDELAVKHIEMMREIRPGLSRVGMLADTTGDGRACKIVEKGAREAARRVGAVFVSYPVASRDDIVRAFAQMQQQRPDVLLPCPMPLLFNNRDLLFETAVKLQIPFTSFVIAELPPGVLFSYGPSFAEGYRKAATYVDRILKGAAASELPIEQPTKLDLIISMKTAKALGLTIPPSLRLRADRVID